MSSAVTRSANPKLSERHIEATCTDFLALDSWRCIKTDLAHLRGLGVQEPGICDRLYIRYMPTVIGHTMPVAPYAEVLWCEWKAKKGVHSQKQKDWQASERARGALIWIAKVDFDPTIEAFQEFYRKSGLMRRKI